MIQPHFLAVIIKKYALFYALLCHMNSSNTHHIKWLLKNECQKNSQDALEGSSQVAAPAVYTWKCRRKTDIPKVNGYDSPTRYNYYMALPLCSCSVVVVLVQLVVKKITVAPNAQLKMVELLWRMSTHGFGWDHLYQKESGTNVWSIK